MTRHDREGSWKPSPQRFHRLLFRLAAPVPVDGFDVRAFLSDREERTQIATKLTAALSLLHQHAPTRLAAFRRDLPRILIGPTHDLAQCAYGARICLLQFDYVTDPQTTPTRLAMTLVHEGTHARLLRAGFPYRERYRRRIERLCVLSEIILARRLSDADGEVRDAEKRLQLSDEYWSDLAHDRRALDLLWQGGLLGKVGYCIVWPVVYLRTRHRKRAANMRLKLAGLSFLMESECCALPGTNCRSAAARPADMLPAA